MRCPDARLVRSLAAAAALAWAASPTWAVGGLDGPNQPVGYVAGVPYAGGEYGGIDSVSPYSGALVLALPIGPGGFRVGPAGLGYGFTLYYSSNVWTYTEGIDEEQGNYVEAVPNTQFTAGLGWNLSFGKVLKPNVAPNTTSHWIYLDPSGGSHKMFDKLHTDDTGTSSVHRFSRDGSFLRLNVSSPSNPVLEFADGTYHTFDSQGRPVSMRDRFLNTVTLSYPNNTTWQIADSDGRLHFVYFDSNPAAGGKIESIELQGYGSTPGNRVTATYDFVYQNGSIRRTCQDTYWANNSTPGDPNAQEAMVAVDLLKIVTGPIEIDESLRVKWRVTDDQQNPAYHDGALRSNQQCHYAGVIERIELPTHGWTSWDWQLWSFPATGKAYVDSSPGVWHRTIINDQSMDWNTATWLYTPSLVTEGVQTDIRDPENNVSKLWFYAPANATLPWDYSLPIWKAGGADAGGRYLSQRRVSAAGATVREVWLKFTSDTLTGIGNDDRILSNRRVVSAKTIYVDDGNRWAQTDLADYDGLGHYREAVSSGNFDLGSNSRTERTQWNDARGCYSQCSGAPNHTIVPPGSPWLLGTFAYTRQSEAGDVATQEYSFNTSTGFLNQRRVLVQQTTQSNNDVLVQYCGNSYGQLTSERYYGGDLNTLAGKVIGCGASTDSTYRLDFEYQSGVLSKSTYKTPAGASVGFDNFSIPAGGVDLTTGLVEKSCDSAGYCTEFDYDLLGRLLQQRGATSAGNARAATVNYAYSYVAGPWQGWQVATTLACPSGLTCSSDELAGFPESTVHYDGFGKAFKTDRRNADGSWSKQYMEYSELGMPTFVSEWTAGVIGTGSEPGTTFSNFDALGRARTITAADGHVTTLAFTGDRISTRTVQIASGAFPPTGPPPEAASTTEYYRDRFGRLVRVREPAGSGGAMVNTDLTYDIGGRQTQIAQGSQLRTYVFDRRGFLKSETIPEYGPSGNGTRYGCSFDALGNAWKTREVACGQSATLGVSLAFDYAIRVTSVSEEGGNLLKEFLYEPTTGRLATAKAHNYLPEVGFNTFRVDETYAYGGIAGAVSSRTTQFVVNGTPEEQFVTTLGLDRAGQLQSLGYPACSGGACGGTGPGTRNVTFQHSKGYLSKIPGFIDTAITYHANGMLAQRYQGSPGTVLRVDQVIDTTTMMRRPKQINVFDGGGVALSYSGNYEYDGAGNIKAMANARNYRYDAVSRLIESRETWGSTTYVQKPTFDAYGNIQSLETGAMGFASTLSTPTSASTNRLTTAGTTYDPAGNLTLWANGPAYHYDRLNRMRRFVGGPGPGAEEWVFGYTADDERVLSMRVGGSGEKWTIRGLDNQILREIRADAGVHALRDYVWSGRELLSKVERTPSGGSWNEATIHVGSDHLATPRILYDGSPPADSHIYYPFGQELTTSTDTERIKFTGHERDLWNTSSTADDLDYMHARHYNPQLARFLQIDPRSGVAAKPQTLNRYGYVAGNPINAVDPTGMMMGQCTWKAINSVTTSDSLGNTTTTITLGLACTVGDGTYVFVGEEDPERPGRERPVPTPPGEIPPNDPKKKTEECAGTTYGITYAFSGPMGIDFDKPGLVHAMLGLNLQVLPDGVSLNWVATTKDGAKGASFGLSLTVNRGEGSGSWPGRAESTWFSVGPLTYGKSGPESGSGGWRTDEIGGSTGAPAGYFKGVNETSLIWKVSGENGGCMEKR